MQDKLLYTCRLSVASIRQTKSLDFCYMMQETALLNSFFFFKANSASITIFCFAVSH